LRIGNTRSFTIFLVNTSAPTIPAARRLSANSGCTDPPKPPAGRGDNGDLIVETDVSQAICLSALS
jgi:hypothetical protein